MYLSKVASRKLVTCLMIAIFISFLAFFFLDKAGAIFVSSKIPIKIQKLLDALSLPIDPLVAPLYILLAIQLYRDVEKKRDLLVTLGLFVLLNLSFTTALKVVLSRPRPDLFLGTGLYGIFPFDIAKGYTSMPSGHASAAGFLSATIYVFASRKQKTLILIPFFFSSFRFFGGLHFISDIILGYSLSFFGTLLCLNYQKILSSKFNHLAFLLLKLKKN